MPAKPTSTYLLHCFIAGLQYYDVLEIWKCLKIGDQVELIPEPEKDAGCTKIRSESHSQLK